MAYSLNVNINDVDTDNPKKNITRSVFQDGLNEIEAFARIRNELNIWEAGVHNPKDSIEISLYHHDG